MKSQTKNLISSLSNHKIKYEIGFWRSSISWNSSDLDRRVFLKLLDSNNQTTIEKIIVVEQAYGEDLNQALAQSDRPDLSSFKMEPRKEVVKIRMGEFTLQSESNGPSKTIRIFSRNAKLINRIAELLLATR